MIYLLTVDGSNLTIVIAVSIFFLWLLLSYYTWTYHNANWKFAFDTQKNKSNVVVIDK